MTEAMNDLVPLVGLNLMALGAVFFLIGVWWKQRSAEVEEP